MCLKQFRGYCIIGTMAATGLGEQKVRSFLHFCRTEKGLAFNSLEAYRRDLASLLQWLNFKADRRPLESVTLETLRSYLDHLRATGLSNRSIARQVTTLRGF